LISKTESYTGVAFVTITTVNLSRRTKEVGKGDERKSRRRQEGRRILEHVAQYSIESGEDKPVTAARKFIIQAEVFYHQRYYSLNGMNTTDRYFWAEKDCLGLNTWKEIISCFLVCGFRKPTRKETVAVHK